MFNSVSHWSSEFIDRDRRRSSSTEFINGVHRQSSSAESLDRVHRQSSSTHVANRAMLAAARRNDKSARHYDRGQRARYNDRGHSARHNDKVSVAVANVNLGKHSKDVDVFYYDVWRMFWGCFKWLVLVNFLFVIFALFVYSAISPFCSWMM